jgi:protein phosphatase
MKAGRNPRVAAYYGAGALLLVPIILFGWPWSAILIWPAVALVVLAIGYLAAGPAIYGKRAGRVPGFTRLLFAPTLLGQDLSWRHYRKRSRPWDEAAPGLLMGRVLDDSESAGLVEAGATAVLDLTAEFSEPEALRALDYHNLQLLDLTAPSPDELGRAAQFVADRIHEGGTVFVHCKAGYSRTATVVGAYLMASGICAGLQEAVDRLHDARAGMVIRPEALEALRQFKAGLGSDQ